jgi:hypothetical protein
MFGSEMLEVAIGLSLIYLVLGSACSAAREFIEAAVKSRAANLDRGLRELLQDTNGTGLVRELYEHPLIFGTFKGDYAPRNPHPLARWVPLWCWLPHGGDLPSYISAQTFSAALLDLMIHGTSAQGSTAPVPDGVPLTMPALRSAVQSIQNTAVQRVLMTAIDRADEDVEDVRKRVEEWFDCSMDRLSGWYKRQTQAVLLVLAAIVTLAANVDTLAMARYLSTHEEVRKELVVQAETEAQAGAANASTAAAEKVKALQKLGLPLGPSAPESESALEHLFGLIITALAVSLGAPFWFDMLSKLISIRSSIKPQESAAEVKPEEQTAAVRAVPAVPASAPGGGTVAHRWKGADPTEGVL